MGENLTKRSQRFDWQLAVILVGVSISSANNAWTNSVSQTLIEVFPDIPTAIVRSAVTAGSLSSLVAGILVGAIVGRALSYRRCAIIGLLCCTIGGVIPGFFHSNFWVIWFCRLLTGCGAFVNRLSQPLLSLRVGSEKQAKWFGYANVVSSVVSIIMQNLAGKLAATAWYRIYYVNLFMLIPLVLVIFFLKEPEVEKADTNSKTKMNFKIDKRVVPYLLLVMWGHLTLYPVFTSVSTVVAAKGFGGVDVAARVGSLYTVGCLVMSFFIGALMGKARRWTFTIGLIMAVVGLGCILIAPNVIVLTVGTFIAGASYPPMIFSVNAFSSDVAKADVRAFSMIVVMAGASIAGFASSFWTSFIAEIVAPMLPFLSSDVECVSFVNIVVCLLIAAVTIFWDPSVPVRKED